MENVKRRKGRIEEGKRGCREGREIGRKEEERR
jgi:hypothetical protein